MAQGAETSSRFQSVYEMSIKGEQPHVPFTGLHLKSLSEKFQPSPSGRWMSSLWLKRKRVTDGALVDTRGGQNRNVNHLQICAAPSSLPGSPRKIHDWRLFPGAGDWLQTFGNSSEGPIAPTG